MGVYSIYRSMRNAPAVKHTLLRLLDGLRGRGRPPDCTVCLGVTQTKLLILSIRQGCTLINWQMTLPHRAIPLQSPGRCQRAHGVRAGPWRKAHADLAAARMFRKMNNFMQVFDTILCNSMRDKKRSYYIREPP